MEQKILASTKKVLQIGPDDEAFDLDVMTHINSAFSTLNDLGVGPPLGFVLESGEEEWSAFTADPVLQSKVKTAVFLRVRLLFDPPQTAHLLKAAQDQLTEVEWRLSMNREASDWVHPEPTDVMVVDGGDPAGL